MPSRFLLIAVIILLLVSCQAWGNEPPRRAELPFPDIASAAIVGGEGVVLNPAALFINRSLALQFYHSFAEGDISGDKAILLSAGGFGFGYQRLALGTPEIISRYDFSLSSRAVRNLYTGLSYTYYKANHGPLDKAHSWNASLLYHASSIASIAAQARNFNRHTFDGARSAIGYLLSVAIKPMKERLTLGGDLLLYGGQSLDQGEWKVSSRIIVKKGLALYGAYSHQHRFGVGIELHMGEGFLGGESFFDRDSRYTRSTVYAGYSTAPRNELIPRSGQVLHVDLSGEIPEEKPAWLLPFRAPETVYQKLAKIQAARNDPRIKGLLLTVSNPGIGWGKLADFRRAVADFQQAGKPVICYLGVMPSNGSYYLASVADKVFMPPVGALNLTGLRAEVTFYRGTLDKLGIEPQVERVGEYKNYPDQFTDSTLSEPHREALEAVLDDLFSHVVAEVSASRRMTSEHLEKIIDTGPFTSIQAESLGLIDGRFYPVELQGKLPELIGGSSRLLSSSSYLETPAFRERFGEPPQIAVISVAGSITTGKSGSSVWQGQTAGSATISQAIRRAKENPSVKAIVMRMDTPGGDALASDLIWGELVSAREAKPVIVSMSDVCASGGYYIASASDEIILEPTTITGSIGVFWGKANMEGFYRKLGMTTETITRGKHANIFSMKSGYSSEERSIVRRQVRDLYRHFISIVAENRRLPRDSIDDLSRGRVWSGRQALANGLADSEGSILDAIAVARRQAGIKGEDFRVLEMSRRGRSLFDLPEFFFSATSWLFGGEQSSGLSALRWLGSVADDATLQMRLPYDLAIE